MFCRNVLIYFDQPTKTSVLNRLARQMPDDGYLVLGAAETVVGLTDAFKPVHDRRGLYEPNAGARGRRFADAGAANVLKFAAKSVNAAARAAPDRRAPFANHLHSHWRTALKGIVRERAVL